MKKGVLICQLVLTLLSLNVLNASCQIPEITNPVIDGYFADPSIVSYSDSFFVYATIDPWGGNELAVFSTKDFKNWERHHLLWPTKQSCSSSSSSSAKVWAPSVVKGNNGKYYMYVSVGSEVWVGVSDHPSGQWKNAKKDNSPLISRNYFEGYHMIDAECFIDDDGQAYLYWGSGLNWVNGKCFVVKLKNDMVTFDGAPKDITPSNYFEAPYMHKRNGIYYLMYSDGKCSDSTYKVRYSTGKTPYGPWTEGVNSPILSTSPDSITIGPGHHTVFTVGNQDYILYHRIFPQKKEFLLRQLCVDSLNFDNNEAIKKVNPVGISEFMN